MSDRKSTEGRWLTKALFWEERHPSYTPSFTLKSESIEKDGIIYPSLKQMYLEYADPTEYSFAVEVIGDWDHWQTICDGYFFKPLIKKWREELEIKLRSQAVKAIINTASTEGAKGTTAAKYVAEKGWEKRAGRPSNAEVEAERKIHAGIKGEVAEDAERLGLH